MLSALPSLLIVLLMSIVSLVSMRAAGKAVSRMRRRRESSGLRVGQLAITLGFAVSAICTVLSGGVLLALVLVG